jgi:hypothetical protein
MYMTHSQMLTVDAWVTDLLCKITSSLQENNVAHKCGFKEMLSSLSQNLTTNSVHTLTATNTFLTVSLGWKSSILKYNKKGYYFCFQEHYQLLRLNSINDR